MKKNTIFFLFFISSIINAQDNYLVLNGTNAYMRVPDHPGLDLSNSLTVEAWIYLFGQTPVQQNMVRKNDNYLLGWINGGYANFQVLVFTTGASGWSGLISTYPLSWFENQWVHVAMTYNQPTGELKLYINGILDNSTVLSGNPTLNTTNAPLHIGSVSYNVAEFFNGQIDEVRIWDYARSSSQIFTNYYNSLTLPQSGLEAYYKFDQLENLGAYDAGADDIQDMAENGHHGDLEGGWSVIGDDAPLPIELKYFKISQSNNNQIELEWMTSSELENDFFIIERSLNAHQFTAIGQIDGNGTSLNDKLYTFSDFEPLHGLNYYRLKQVDFEGDFTFSPIVSATTPDNINQDFVRIFPNPAKNTIKLLGVDFEFPKEVIIYNQVGQVVLRKEVEDAKIDVSLLLGGLYFLEMEVGGRRIWEWLVVE